MAAFLIAEEGILAGTNLPLVEEEEWILGRDPDVCFHVLADPMVSRKHALIRLQDAHYFIENLSSTNPVMVNGENVIDPIELQEDDMIQIGSSTFRFSHSLPEQPLNPLSESTEETQTANLFDDIRPEEDFSLGRLSFTTEIQSRWMIKVTAGPNAGAEFTIRAGESYILGKDSNQADILFQDLSVSRQHARLTCSEEEVVSIEDLGSRNGVLINGSLSEGITELKSQDLVAMGTTAFLVIDREATRETIYSPPSVSRYIDHELSEDERKEAKEKAHDLEEELILKRNWKETLIPFRHLMIGFLLLILVASGVIGVISLFQTSTVTIAKRDEMGELKKLLHNFPGVQFTFNPDTGELFLVGHVVTDVAYQEMLYLLKSQTYIKSTDDNVIIDELVWENINSLLFRNPEWRSVLVTGSKPGQFIVKGYLQTLDQLGALNDFLNRNFPYLDRLKNDVVIENNLETNITSLLAENDFLNVTFQSANGEFVFSGRVDTKREMEFNQLMSRINALSGVRQIKSFVIYTTQSSSRIDVSNRFKVTGTSRYGDTNRFVLINGKILSIGDALDGMIITVINPDTIFLEKEGIKYKIDYNLQ